MNTSIPFPSTSHNDNNFSILEHTNNDEKDSKQDRGNQHTETNSKKNDKDKYKYYKQRTKNAEKFKMNSAEYIKCHFSSFCSISIESCSCSIIELLGMV